MHRRRLSVVATLTIAAMSGLVPLAQSATITQTYAGLLPATIAGTLPNQDTALLQQFTLPAPATLAVSTSSYATGGFQANLLLFDSLGNFITAGTPAGSPDGNTGIVGDVSLTAPSLSAGMYTVALTDFLLNQSLTATNLSDGFTENFGSGITFVDANGNTRTGDYSLTISAVTDAGIPEPSSLLLVSSVLLLAGAWSGKRRSRC